MAATATPVGEHRGRTILKIVEDDGSFHFIIGGEDGTYPSVEDAIDKIDRDEDGDIDRDDDSNDDGDDDGGSSPSIAPGM